MTNIEAIFIWIALYIYFSSFIAFLWGFVFKKEKPVIWGWRLALIGYLPHNISMIIRWVETGHAPVMRSYENATLGAWFILLIYFTIRWRSKKLEILGIAIVPIILLMIGNGIMSKPYLEPLSPPFRSNWLILHVLFAWIAYGTFCIMAALGMVYLLKSRALAAGKEIPFYERFPDLNILDYLLVKTAIFGFIALSVGVGAGAIWAYGLWGRYWGWDPIETWSLITWLVYAIYIHLGVTLGWKGKRMAWLAIVSIIFVFITFGGIGFIQGIHTTIL
ncbi:MAG: cytochrome c biogenesis protein CcsA [Deltaproteobacteria bacterium]|nr:cytochrome c biogenesis protein CcsA [Deltaproteobacteria bacterium]